MGAALEAQLTTHHASKRPNIGKFRAQVHDIYSSHVLICCLTK
jgi:hypothetical protein